MFGFVYILMDQNTRTTSKQQLMEFHIPNEKFEVSSANKLYLWVLLGQHYLHFFEIS